MCDYGQLHNLTQEELYYALNHYVLPELDGIDVLLFGTYGSIFDSFEMSDECLHTLFAFLKDMDVEYILFETHYSTITNDILEKIRTNIPHRSIDIELGFETYDKKVQKILNKYIDLDELDVVIQNIHNHDMEVELNVLLGAPQLTLKRQLDTALDSILWAFSHGADRVVLFPLTIKPFTYLYELYEKDLKCNCRNEFLTELLR